MRTYIYPLFAIAFVEGAIAQQASVPEPFRGVWASSTQMCGVPHEGSLTIAATEVFFYESRGKVLAVRVIGPRDIEVDLESRGEGSVWKDTRRFVLSDDGRRVTNVMPHGGLTRTRCS